MARKKMERSVTEAPRYHDTWRLLKKYRDVVWSLELSVQQVRTQFQIEYDFAGQLAALGAVYPFTVR